MNAAARRRHRAMVLIMGVVIPIVFVWGMISRQQIPVLPAAIQADIVGDKIGHFELAANNTQVQVDVLQQGTALKLHWPQMQPLPYADILVYWQQGESFENAILVGRYVPNRAGVVQQVPAVARPGNAQLVLYALAHQQEIASAPLQHATGGAP